MIIKKVGRYEFIDSWKERVAYAIYSFSKGDILNITQIDKGYHKIIGDELHDWHYWDLPVKELA